MVDFTDVQNLLNDTVKPRVLSVGTMVMKKTKFKKDMHKEDRNLYSAIRDIRREQLRGDNG